MPDQWWWIKTPEIENADKIPDVTGGYLVGSFEIINPVLPGNDKRIGKYRFIHEYNYNQDPEYHEFFLAGSEGYIIENIHFGHSYGYLFDEELWRFENWMKNTIDTTYFLGSEPILIPIDWKGLLPYPEGELYHERVPEIKPQGGIRD